MVSSTARRRGRDVRDTGRQAANSPALRFLAQGGLAARGVLFVTAGVFLVVAAMEAQPQQAKGLDSALRAPAATPLGPWLLVAVAIGLIMFGAYSCCQAGWRRL